MEILLSKKKNLKLLIFSLLQFFPLCTKKPIPSYFVEIFALYLFFPKPFLTYMQKKLSIREINVMLKREKTES